MSRAAFGSPKDCRGSPSEASQLPDHQGAGMRMHGNFTIELALYALAAEAWNTQLASAPITSAAYLADRGFA